MHNNTLMHTKTKFFEFLVVKCCISLNMNFPQSLLKFKIFIIKFPKYLLLIFLALNAFFFPKCHVKTVQYDISVKTIRL